MPDGLGGDRDRINSNRLTTKILFELLTERLLYNTGSVLIQT
jgi:hypothetical protein